MYRLLLVEDDKTIVTNLTAFFAGGGVCGQECVGAGGGIDGIGAGKL